MKRFSKYIYLALLVFLSSCSDKEDDSMPLEPDPFDDIDIPVIDPNGEEQYLTLDSDYLFDQTKLATYELILSDENLAKIDADPAAEEYVEGMLVFEGDTISPVGIRYKGSIGGFVNCVSGSDWANPSGYKTCTKLSMKVKINWEGREEKFYGLKKLQFHSQNLDDSKMHERLGYWLFQQMGVPSPRSVHARLMINGVYSGLYALTEQIDGRFAKYNFEDGDGNVYKEVWPLNMAGMPHSENTYINALKTNEDLPNIDIMYEFAQMIANADSEEIKDVILENMDINEIISYIVVDRMIKHDDGPFHWYCGFSCNPHNFYWYEEPTNKKLHLIPWDLDNAFDNIVFPSNGIIYIADEWGEISNNCEPFNTGAFGFQQRSAACDKLTAGWVAFEDEYAQLRNDFLTGPFAESQVNSLIDTWANQIRTAVAEANLKHEDAISVAEWENSLSLLKQQLEYARDN